MKNFTVEREYLLIREFRRERVCSDGSEASDGYDVDSENLPTEITTGFVVELWDEDNRINDHIFFPVETNMDDFTNNEQEVLERIKKEFPAGDYQNNDW